MVMSTEDGKWWAACTISIQLEDGFGAASASWCVALMFHITAHKLYPVRVRVLNEPAGLGGTTLHTSHKGRLSGGQRAESGRVRGALWSCNGCSTWRFGL